MEAQQPPSTCEAENFEAEQSGRGVASWARWVRLVRIQNLESRILAPERRTLHTGPGDADGEEAEPGQAQPEPARAIQGHGGHKQGNSGP